MSNFDLIDDYLTNRLGEQDKVMFEQRLVSDPAFKADVEFQKSILDGVKHARVAELKAMLNNVPVGGGLSSGVTAGKIAAGLVAAGIVATSLYLYLAPSDSPTADTVAVPKNKVEQAPVPEKAPEVAPATAIQTPTEQVTTTSAPKAKSKKIKKKEISKPGAAPQPKIEVVDPSEELVDNSAKAADVSGDHQSGLTASHIAVETNTSHKKYNFHYQFDGGKLVLYGPFDKSLYEILEIHGDQHTVFLYYKDDYYLLDEKQSKVGHLEPIKDAALLKKLKEYRGRK